MMYEYGFEVWHGKCMVQCADMINVKIEFIIKVKVL